MTDISGRSTDRLFAGNSKLLSSLSLCGACHRKEKGACFVNYCSLLAWLMALCWALLSEVLYKMDLWHVAYHWLSSSQIPNLQQQPFFMPHDFVGEEFRSGSAAQLYSAMWH